jgi:predicted acylesterase/phospholipase RssA
MAGRNQSGSKIALALAGGGPEGAIYEIGALRALDEALEGLDFNDLPVYVGVSAGAFVGACLANGLTPKQLVKGVVHQLPYGNPIEARTFFTPALREFLRRSCMTPALLLDAIWDYAARGDALLSSMSRLSGSVPVALFDNEPIAEYLRKVFRHEGRTDDFRMLKPQLTVVAADLDSATATRFGEPGFDHVPISKAVQASAALPGLYPPVLIDGHYYVDGVLLKTLHASVALEKDADLVVCVNPIVPIDISKASELGLHGRSLVSEGLPMVLSQTLRTIIHSRMRVGMAAYAPRYPDRDVILFEPGPDDSRMFFTYIFSFSARKTICEHAYRLTRADLLERYDELSPTFHRHGIRLCREVLEDQSRTVWGSVEREPDITTPVTQALDHLLTKLESWLDQDV